MRQTEALASVIPFLFFFFLSFLLIFLEGKVKHIEMPRNKI